VQVVFDDVGDDQPGDELDALMLAVRFLLALQPPGGPGPKLHLQGLTLAGGSGMKAEPVLTNRLHGDAAIRQVGDGLFSFQQILVAVLDKLQALFLPQGRIDHFRRMIFRYRDKFLGNLLLRYPRGVIQKMFSAAAFRLLAEEAAGLAVCHATKGPQVGDGIAALAATFAAAARPAAEKRSLAVVLSGEYSEPIFTAAGRTRPAIFPATGDGQRFSRYILQVEV